MWLDVIICILLFLLGSALASFFGVIADRVPNGESIVSPPSHCPACGHELKWYENIPVFGWLFAGGKCRNCKEKIGAFYLIYELIGGAVCVLCYLAFGLSVETLFVVPLALVLLLMAGYDFKTNTILDVFWVIFAVLALGLFLYRVFALGEGFASYLIGAVVGFGFFGLVKLVSGLITKATCLGGGDVIVMGVAGLVLGWASWLFSVLIATLVGLLIEGTLMLTKRKPKESLIAFCPYLSLGIFLAMLYGEQVIQSVLKVVI